eukprot:2631428-Pyramimonas_sp.AAC.1
MLRSRVGAALLMVSNRLDALACHSPYSTMSAAKTSDFIFLVSVKRCNSSSAMLGAHADRMRITRRTSASASFDVMGVERPMAADSATWNSETDSVNFERTAAKSCSTGAHIVAS